MSSRAATLIVLAIAACKADPDSATTASGSSVAVGSATTLAPPGSGSGSGSGPSLGSLMPSIEGAKILQTRTPSGAHSIATWCIDEADPLARISAALERDGWTGIRTRGTGTKRAVAAQRGELRFSAITAASDARCAGTVVNATVMELGPIELPHPGDVIH